MRRPSFIQKIGLACRYLFVFRKPSCTELDFIDLVIDDKALFLLSWKIEHGYKVRIRKTRAAFWEKEKAVVILLKKQTDHIEISISNLWRKTSFKVALKHTRFDEQTTTYLLKEIRTVKNTGEVIWNTPLNGFTVHPIRIAIHKAATILRNSIPKVQPPIPVFSKKFVIHSQKLIY
ncbi:MAG: hypothetical protein EOP48_13515, partial [Sphingobacteriales bacterium]